MNAKEANRRSRQGQAAAEKHEPTLRDKYEAVLRANAKRVAGAYRKTGINVDGEGVSDRKKARGITAAGKVPTLDEVLADATLAKSATARTKVERQRIAEEAAHPIITEAGKRELRALLEPLVAAQAGVQAERIVAGVRDRVAAIMLEALTEGYSVPDTAALLQANLELDAVWQAEMLARTDLISLSNAGSHAAAASLEDGPKFKTWLSAGDNRVRPTHVDANRQTVPIDKPYKLAEGVELQYPGDPAGPDGETINCRCVSVFTDSPAPGLSHSRDGGIHDEPVTAFDAPVAAAGTRVPIPSIGTVAAGFDPLKHPRHQKGVREGGRFARSALTPTHSPDLDDEVDERHDQFVIDGGLAAKHGMTPDEYLDASSEWLQSQVEGQEIRIRAPVDSVKGILEQGFKTPERMLEEGADVNAWVGRRDLEQHYFGALDPTYGYLSGIPEDNGHPVTMYGEAVFRMKPEVEFRSTLTLGDSANVIVDQSRDGLDFVPTDVTHPDQRSIDFTSTGDVLGSDLRQYTGVYVETQTWGGVNVNDVHEIVYTEGTVPDGPTREALGKAGVPWRTVPSSDPNPPPVTVRAGDVLHHRSWVEKDGTPTPMTVTEITDDGYVIYKLPQDTEPRGDSLREFYWKAGKDADARTVVGAAFDPAKHPRYESGRREGGRFAPKAGTSTAQAQAQAEDAAAEAQHVDAEVAAPGRKVPLGYREERFNNVAGDFYELGKLDDAELDLYADWADQVAFDLEGDPEFLRYAVNARQVIGQRAADRLAWSTPQPGVVGNVQPMNVNSMNPVFKGELDGQQVVVKPQRSLSGANVRTFVEPGFDLEREEAAAHVGKLLREDAPEIAPNVLSFEQHDVPGLGRSGVTPFVNGQTVALLETTFPDRVGKVIAPDIRKIRLYDAVIGNTDRHTGNIMVTYPTAEVFPIDHGLAFPSVNSEDWPALQGGPMVTELEPDERGALERLRPRLAADTKLPTLLTADQIRAMDDRIGFMLHTNRIINTTDWQSGLEDG